MPKIEVKKFQAHMTRKNMEPHWEAVIDYGGYEVTIPLPGRLLVGDDRRMQRREAVEAMERLGAALFHFSDQFRKQSPSDWE